MNKYTLYFFAALCSSLTLTACDGGGSSPHPVVPPDNGGNVTPPDNGEGGDPSPPDNPDTPEGPDAPCADKTYANALSALQNRNATKASEAELIAYSQCVLEQQISNPTRQQAINQIYQGLGNTFSWEPGKQAQVFQATPLSKSFMLLGVNAKRSALENGYSQGLAMAGEQNGHRYIALSTLPATDAASLTWFKNMVGWLSEAQSRNRATYNMIGTKDDSLHVVMANSSQYKNLKSLLDALYPGSYTLNEDTTCDYEALSQCLNSRPVDLLIVGDADGDNKGYEGIREGIEYAVQNKIPLITAAGHYKLSPLIDGVYQYMGITGNGNGNYWHEYYADAYPLTDLTKPSEDEQNQRVLLSNLASGSFDSAVIDDTCTTSVLSCKAPEFLKTFRSGAEVYRNMLINLDAQNIDVLADTDKYALWAAGVLLADKYRQKIDYPISATNESTQFLNAMFADWVVNYSRPDNIPQADLGEFVIKADGVVKGDLANFKQEATVSEQRQFTVPYPKQWTTSSWYAPAGKSITISSSKQSAAVVIHPGFGYTDTYQSARHKSLVAPSEASQKDVTRLVLAPGESRTFSTPYGGPLYIRFTDDTLTTADLAVSGVMKHPVIMDMSDSTQIDGFDQKIATTEFPQLDIRTDGVELHLLKYRFSLNNPNNVGITTTRELLDALQEYYIWNYTLGGFKTQGKTLNQSLPADELAVCSSLFGLKDCTDEAIHTRTVIQHINYDQRSRCPNGAGCSGNPFDTSWAVRPYGWGESHELGHNLQINQLNVQYVPDGNKEDWTKYQSRAGEVSNNIFPYHTLWMSTYGKGKTDAVATNHGSPLDVYAVIMSELRGLKDSNNQPVIYDAQCRAYEVTGVTANRYTAPWQSNEYAIYNSYREAFYYQMMLQADKQPMRDGTILNNGFGIYTLLYQNARIFAKYAQSDERSWNANRAQLGFGNFAYQGDITYGGKMVKDIPGNDFMLVALSNITNMDWRPYFDMFGLHYTSLASQQVEANGYGRKVEQKMLTNNTDPQRLPNADLSQDPNITSVDMTDKNAVFPGQSWDCK